MRRLAILLLAAHLLQASEAAAQPRARIDSSALEAGLEAVPDSWLFVFERGSGGERARRSLAGRGVPACRPGRLAPRVVSVQGLDQEAVERLLDLPGLVSVAPDALLRLQLRESLPQVRGDTVSLQGAGFPDTDGEGIRACVIDSGIRASHEAFGGRVDVAAGLNTAEGGSDTSDVEGHGTHVASILAGSWPDGRSGVAPSATLVPVRACRADRTCPTSAVIAGIDHCADPAGGAAQIINLSLGGVSFFGACDSDPLAVAANAAVEAGLVVVAASGNDGNDDSIDTPSCGSKVLSVGAVYDASFITACGDPFSDADERACSSNASPELDLCAPGADITAAGSSSDTALRIARGTSMATPHVAGLVALVLQRAPNLSPQQVGELLRDNAVDLGPTGPDSEYGHGRIDVVATLAALAPCGSCPNPGWGDLHPEGGDEVLELADWLILRRLALAGDAPTAEQLVRGDLSPGTLTCTPELAPSTWCPLGDGGLDLNDLAQLRRASAGLELFSCEPCPSAEPQDTGNALRAPGDVAPSGGGDGVLDVADVLRLLRFVVALEAAGAEDLLRGDVAPALRENDLSVVSGDGALDVADVLLSLRVAVGLESLAWPAREFVLSAGFAEGIAAAQISLSGWPGWALPGGPGVGCGTGGGLDVLGDRWTLTCAWDPVELPSGSVLARPWYRAPEALSALSLTAAGAAVNDALETVALDSVMLED